MYYLLCCLIYVHTEELAMRIRRAGLGIRAQNEEPIILIYACDVVMISKSCEDFHVILD